MIQEMRVLCIIIILSLTSELYAQCTKPDFSVSPNACVNETLEIVNHTLSASSSYEWDFCSGDLTSFPVVTPALSNENFYRARSLRFVREGETWHAFAISATANNLIRLDFDNGILAMPSFHDMGSPDQKLSSAFSFDAIQVAETWHLFVANTGSKNLVRLTFSNGLTNAPSVQVLETPDVFNDAGPNFIRIVEDGNSFYGFVSVGTALSNTKIVRLDFGSSITNAVPALSEFAVSGSNQLRGMAFSKVCDQWVGFALSMNTNALYRLSFVNGLGAAPTTSLMSTGAVTLNTPVNIELVDEGGNYYALIQNARIEEGNAALYRITFGESPMDPIQGVEKLQTPELTGGAYALDVVESNSSWYAFTFNLATKTLLRMAFSSPCSASIPVSFIADPGIIHYTSPGNYKITLRTKDVDGNVFSKSQNVSVSAFQAPEIAAASSNMCAGHDVAFSSNTSDNIATYDWRFGDGATSSLANPTHQYAEGGDFEVTLHVMASDNGCGNFVSIPLRVYNPPSSAFTLPAQMLCTNNTFRFETATSDVYDGNLSYQWFVDGNAVSTERDLQYSFINTGSKDIKLITAIPGCADEVTQSTPAVEAGPVVDFSFTGACEGDTFSFVSDITDPVESYLWNFDDGNTSTGSDAANQFASYGAYAVSLTATNATGCENVKTKIVPVYAKPVVDFSVEGPPNACSGVTTFFQNLTATPDGTEITAWQWTIDDPGNPAIYGAENAQHVFAAPGSYPVALAAVSERGCQQSVEKEVVISRAPATDFSVTPPCEDVAVQFTAPADNTITGWYWEIGTSYYVTSSATHTFPAPGDYPLSLELVADNGCVSRLQRTIHVPAALHPDFSVLRNCLGQEAVFTDMTTGVDPVIARQWFVNGTEAATGPSMTRVFDQTGSQPIALQVTTATGCVYSIEKPVVIVTPPTASFLADPPSGALPLEVRFANTSGEATRYSWQFLDGSDVVSTDTSPVHTFNSEGSFDVILTAFNEQQCADVRVESITTVAPLPDADIEIINTTSNADGSLKLIVTIRNAGNTVLKNIPLDIDFSGNLTLRQILEGPVTPGAKQNVVLNTGIVNTDALRYMCVYLNLENDLSPQGNRMCKPFETTLLALPAHPNPTASTLNVEWISPAESTVRLVLLDALGRTVFGDEVGSAVGLNRQTLNVEGLYPGMYYLRIFDANATVTQRILVSGNP